MAVSYYQQHRPRESTITVSLSPDFSGDFIGDGTADDVEIQASITFVEALGGGNVVLNIGNYDITASLTPAVGNITIEGVSRTAVILTLANDADVHMVEIVTIDNVTIERLTFEGNKAQQIAGVHVIRAVDSSYLTLRDLVVNDAKVNGIIVTTSAGHVYGTFIENCFVDNSDASGIHIGANSNTAINYGAVVIGGRVSNCGITGLWLIGDGIYANGVNANGNTQYGINVDVLTSNTVLIHTTVDGCTCYDNTLSGIIVNGTINPVFAILTANHCFSNGNHGIVTVQRAIINGNDCHNNTNHGIMTNSVNASNSVISSNHCFDNDDDGIFLTQADYVTVIGNSAYDTGAGLQRDGISLDNTSEHNTVTGNNCHNNITRGIICDSDHNTITGNTCNDNLQQGIQLVAAHQNTITGNNCSDNTRHGIYLESSNDNTVTGNTCNVNAQDGIRLYASVENTVVGNTCNGNDTGTTGTFNGISLQNTSTDNIVHSNTCNDNDRYGIEIKAAADARNWVKDNLLMSNTLGAFLDIGTDTKLAVKVFQFIQGTTFISTAANPWGWEIDLDTEFALALGHLPLEVQQVVRINIWAVGLVSPGVADAYMRAQFTGEAAASDEVYTTEPIDVVDKDCVENNPAANDVIHWMLDPTDDADIGDLLGGDSIQFKVLHEGGAGDNIETDAIFRYVEVEYV